MISAGAADELGRPNPKRAESRDKALRLATTGPPRAAASSHRASTRHLASLAIIISHNRNLPRDRPRRAPGVSASACERSVCAMIGR